MSEGPRDKLMVRLRPCRSTRVGQVDLLRELHTMKEWSIKEAKRITRIAQFMPEAMREEYIGAPYGGGHLSADCPQEPLG